MLNRLHGAVALTALSLACGQGAPAATTQGTPPLVSTSSALAGLPSYDPATVLVVHGGFSTLYYKTPKQGHLRVEVQHRRTPEGVEVKVVYERQVNCRRESVAPGRFVAGCTVAWRDNRKVSEAAFTYDATLDLATLTDTVRGKILRVQWVGYGEATRQINENGNLLVQIRDARGTVTWGRDRYADPAKSDTPSQLFRRVTSLAKP